MKWYTNTNTTQDQGIVIDEETGKSIAVTYKSEDAPLIAAAPELLTALEILTDSLSRGADTIATRMATKQAWAAIAKAKGE